LTPISRAQTKKIAKKQHKAGNFTIDATTPATDEIFDVAAFVCLFPPL
jgi:hypothetical protein